MEARALRVVLNVERLDEVIAFYRDVLQLPMDKSWTDEHGSAAVFSVGDGGTIELVGPPYGMRTDPAPGRGVELMVAVDDAQAWLDRLRSDGVPIARQLIENPWGDRSFGIDDPDGRRVWIFEVL